MGLDRLIDKRPGTAKVIHGNGCHPGHPAIGVIGGGSGCQPGNGDLKSPRIIGPDHPSISDVHFFLRESAERHVIAGGASVRIRGLNGQLVGQRSDLAGADRHRARRPFRCIGPDQGIVNDHTGNEIEGAAGNQSGDTAVIILCRTGGTRLGGGAHVFLSSRQQRSRRRDQVGSVHGLTVVR